MFFDLKKPKNEFISTVLRKTVYNGSQLKNSDISGALYTLRIQYYFAHFNASFLVFFIYSSQYFFIK